MESNPELLSLLQDISLNQRIKKFQYDPTSHIVSFEKYYDLDNLSTYIKGKNYSRIVLQFTNEILSDSIKILEYLQKATNSKFFILSDNSKNGCCIDLTGARHANPELIVHFGDACLSDDLTTPIDIKYVFPKQNFDEKKFASILKGFVNKQNEEWKKQPLLIILGISYQYKVNDILEIVDKIEITKGYIAHTIDAIDDISLYQPLFYGRYVESKLYNGKLSASSPKNLLVIENAESCLLENIVLAKTKFNFTNIYQYDPESQESINKASLDHTKFMTKRLFLLQKAQNANVFGILITKSNLEKYFNLMQRVKTLLNSCKKKYYTFLINKLTEPKLANFPEVDAYVIISCPFSSFYDFKEYYKIILNPFELELLLSETSWSDYILADARNMVEEDFKINTNIEKDNTKKQEEEKEAKNQEKAACDELIKRNDSNQLIMNNMLQTVDFYNDRKYKGLDVNYDQGVKLATQGKSGIAREYDDEISPILQSMKEY